MESILKKKGLEIGKFRSKMNTLSSDVFTAYIFTRLSNQDQIALLAAFPTLSSKVNWKTIYDIQYDSLSCQLINIYNKYFKVTHKDRLDAMRYYYDNVDIGVYPNIHFDKNYAFRKIPIIEPVRGSSETKLGK